jgi:hypothetical protein
MKEGDITFPDIAAFELPGEVTEGLGSAGKEDDSACLPVEAVDRMNAESWIAVDLAPEVEVSLQPGLKDSRETPSMLRLDAQTGGFLHNDPARARSKNRNRERVQCHVQKES